jgi:hypothetical protein
MTRSLGVVLGLPAAAPELRTPAALVEPPSIAEQPIAAAWLIAEEPFEGERLFEEAQLWVVPLIMGVAMAAVTVIPIINIAVEAPTTEVESIEAALW